MTWLSRPPTPTEIEAHAVAHRMNAWDVVGPAVGRWQYRAAPDAIESKTVGLCIRNGCVEAYGLIDERTPFACHVDAYAESRRFDGEWQPINNQRNAVAWPSTQARASAPRRQGGGEQW